MKLPAYPATAAGRDQFILGRRPARREHDPWRYQDVLVEQERLADRSLVKSATVFLTGRECPWRCAMCDLWRDTTTTDTPPGAIPAQVVAARHSLRREAPPVRQLKLYNAGSFFDPRAVPEEDYPAIAAALDGLDEVVVESHPALIGACLDRWLAVMSEASRRRLRLQVAMGLETAHPAALERLHKRMTVEDFREAADGLARRGVELRVFLLLAPPFVPTGEQDAWLLESLNVAFEAGAAVVSLIPTRSGNGTLEALASEDLFRPPVLADIERSAELALCRFANRGRLFVDVWDLERFSTCPACFAQRRERLHRMNLEQHTLPRPVCSLCQSLA